MPVVWYLLRATGHVQWPDVRQRLHRQDGQVQRLCPSLPKRYNILILSALYLQSNARIGDGKVKVWNVLPCNTGKFCCRDSRSDKNCCDDPNALINLDIGTLNLPTRTVTLSGLSSATAASATGTAITSSTTSSTQPSPSAACDKSASSLGNTQCPADNTAVVGGAVGGILGAALIASVIAIIFLLRRRPTSNGQQQQQQEPPKVTYELHSAPAYGQ